MIGILAKTYCLAAVDAAFYQVARGLLLPFTLLLSLFILRPRPYFPPLSLLGVGAVMLGFVIGLSKDVTAHLTGGRGIALGIGSSFTTAVESVVVKRYLNADSKAGAENEKVDDGEVLGVWQTVWMSNIISLVVFLVPLLVVTGDAAKLSTSVAGTSNSIPSSFFSLAFATGFVGFLLTIATFLQIKVTSPTTHMIVTASRGVAQSALAVAVFRETVTSGRVSSMAMILSGSAVYGWAKDRFIRRAQSTDVELQTEFNQKQEIMKEQISEQTFVPPVKVYDIDRALGETR